MIRLEEILQNGEDYWRAPKDVRDGIAELLYKINIVRYFWAKPMIINSGFRNVNDNARMGGAPNSWHTKGLAIDVKDPNHDFYKWLTVSTQGRKLASELGLYFEHSDFTPSWCHIQLRPPKSGNRIFRK